MKLFGTSSTRGFLAQKLQDKTLYSSLYVLGEFITAFLYPASLALTLARDPATKSFRDVLILMDKKYSRYMPSKAWAGVQVLAKISEGGTEDKDDVADRLERMIAYQLLDDFMDTLEPLINTIDCEYAKWDPEQHRKGDRFDGEGLGLNRKTPLGCNISPFIRSHLTEFNAVIKAIRCLAKPDKKQKKALLTADCIDISNSALVCSTCRRLADVIISIECPSHCDLCTENIEHFSVTLPPLGKNWLDISGM